MTKADLAEAVRHAIPGKLTKPEALDTLDELFSIITATLAGGEDLMIQNFGKFEVKHKAQRQGRNIRTGESLTIPSQRRLTFRPALLLKKRVNDGRSLDTAVIRRWKGHMVSWKQEALPL